MDKTFLQSYFGSDFQGIESLMTEVLDPILGDDKELGYDQLTADPEIAEQAAKANIEEIRHAATYYVDDMTIRLFDITLSNSCKIHHARKGIQILVRKFIDHFDGGILIFHYEDPTGRSWRFSYLEKGRTEVASTDAKRYTYLCGNDYPCHTFASRLIQLHSKGRVTAQLLEEAFSVEALSDEFFDKYKEMYSAFCEYLYENRADETKFGREFAEREEKYIRDYVKKMMGRITFLHFLQRKGWIGVQPDEEWGTGDVNFMHKLFDYATPEQKDNFLDEVLEPLFFTCLNKRRDNDLYDTKVANIGKVKVPFLNGGLFEPDEMDDPKSAFPAELFQSLFQFYSEYNFTIDENDPLDAEVGVDPEMLGKIFENLLEDNKDKGAFYTPKEIVNYMCQESLVAYLMTEATNDPKRRAPLPENYEADLRAFVQDPDLQVNKLHKYEKPQMRAINQSLKHVKICDPAIGSGAFPMGLLNLLVSCREALNTALGILDIERAELKKEIIRDNIYGVDIEQGAIDIARLRFWLSIVVDSKTPEALPNFDYKFMRGNSLLEQYDGYDLSHLQSNMDSNGFLLVSDEETAALAVYQEMKTKLFECEDNATKLMIREKVANSVKDLVKSQISKKSTIEGINALDVTSNDQFFLWHTWFADVFDENGGFDIVIGNPPYVVMPKDSSYKKYETYSSLDLYAYFFELGVNLLRTNATLTYITPLGFIKTIKFQSLRDLLEKKTKLIELKNTGDDVFKAAVVPTCITRLVKEKGNWHFSDMQDGGKILAKMDNQKRIDDLCNIQRGLEVGKNKVSKERLDLEILTGSTVQKYIPNTPVYMSRQTYQEYAKEEYYFEGERLLIRETGSSLMVLYLDKKIYCNRSLYTIKLKDSQLDAKYLLGYLCSSLIQFYYTQKFKSETELFPKIRIAQAKQIPVFAATKAQQAPIIAIVDRILAYKKADPSADTTALETEIDHLVYDLYGLTKDEIAIVEGKNDTLSE